MEIIRLYVGETGEWYAQVTSDTGTRYELAFDHIPLGGEMRAALAAMEAAAVVPDIELEAEDGEII